MCPKKVSPYKKLILNSGRTQNDIAHYLGITGHTLTRWMKGGNEASLSLEKWRILAKLLGVSLDDLPDKFGPPDEDANEDQDMAESKGP